MEIFANAMNCLTIFFCVFRMCGPHFNLMSTCKPKTLMSVFDSILVLAMLEDAVI